MPPASAQKLAYNKQFYEKNKPKKQLIDTIKGILDPSSDSRESRMDLGPG